jgi:hypothetical protein
MILGYRRILGCRSDSEPTKHRGAAQSQNVEECKTKKIFVGYHRPRVREISFLRCDRPEIHYTKAAELGVTQRGCDEHGR